MPKITGTVTCYDSTHSCEVRTTLEQTGDLTCLDSTDLFSSYGFVIGETLEQFGDATFRSGLLIPSDGLTLTLRDSTYLDGTYSDGTYSDGTYVSRIFDPISMSYGIWKEDASGDILQGYRFRTPMNPQVGQYYANMEAPSDPGFYKIEWIYRKNQSSYSTAVNQTFYIDYRDGTATGYSTTEYNPYGEHGFIVWLLPTTQCVSEGDTVVLTADIRGTIPAPLTYQWRFDGANISDGGKYSGATTDTLTISDVGISEIGYYTVVVSDLVTSNRAFVEVT